MNPVKSVARGLPLAVEDDPFNAPTYTEWVRRAVRLRQAQPDLAMLFDSTTQEPTDLLAGLIRDMFTEPVSDRFVSSFANGNPYARAALAKRYGAAEDQLIITTGATAGLQMLLEALVTAGDEVLVEQPGFDVLGSLVEHAGGHVRALPRLAPDFRIDVEALDALVTGRTRAAIITNLHNPTGAPMAFAEIGDLADRLAQRGVVLVVDEVYADYASETPQPPAGLSHDNIISVSSLTKVFGLFALKFGWIAARRGLLARIERAAPDGDLGVSKLAHAVAAHVLEDPALFEAHWRTTLAVARPALRASAARLQADGLIAGDVPAAGCVYFPRVVGVGDTLAVGRHLLKTHGVLVAPGEYFGAPGHLRIGFAQRPETLALALARFESGLRTFPF